MVDHAILPPNDARHRDSGAHDVQTPGQATDDGPCLPADGRQDAFETAIRVLVERHQALVHDLGAGSDGSDDDRFDTDRYGQDGDAIGAHLDDVGRPAGCPQFGGATLGDQAAGGQVVDQGGDGAAVELKGSRQFGPRGRPVTIDVAEQGSQIVPSNGVLTGAASRTRALATNRGRGGGAVRQRRPSPDLHAGWHPRQHRCRSPQSPGRLHPGHTAGTGAPP